MSNVYRAIKQHIKEIIERHRLWLNTAGKNGQRAIFSGACLKGVDLSRTDLNGANFFMADLKGANLNGANLSGANLKFANLTGASLRNSNLSVAELNSANLEKADLSEAILYGANLGYANLKSSKLISADFENANIEKADLRKSILIGSNLVHLKNARTALWKDTTLTFAAIDRDTYKNIPSEVIGLYGDSFEAQERQAMIKRSFILSRDCYQAGFLLLGYLNTVVRRTYPDLATEITVKIFEGFLGLIANGLDPPNGTVKTKTHFEGWNMPYISEYDEELQNDVRKLIKQIPSIEYELSILSDLFCYPKPAPTDIRKAKITLAMINEKEPLNFIEIIKTVRDYSNQSPRSNWPAIISETVNRNF